MGFFVSVIIPTYKDWASLMVCLNAIRDQNCPKDQFEVIVVNNAENDSCPYRLPANNMKLFHEPMPGSYAARNKGIKAAKGDVFAFTDSDCIPEPNWLSEGVATMKSNPEHNQIVAGNVELFFRDKHKISFAESYEKMFAFPYKRTSSVVLQSMVTANVFIHKNVFNSIGLFEQKLLSGGDFEFSQRALMNRYKIIYAPTSVVLHPARYSLRDLRNKRKRVFGGKVFNLIIKKKKNRLYAVSNELLKYAYKTTKEIFYAWSDKRAGNIKERFMVSASSILIFLSVVSEAGSLLIRNKARRA